MNSQSKNGKLYLIPVPISEGNLQNVAEEVRTHTLHLKHYFVENSRTARRFLKLLHPDLVIDTLQISEIDKHKGVDFQILIQWIKSGFDIGVMSESGCPSIADPGSEIVAQAQLAGMEVKPLTGPNAILLALMASGLNGQSFCFIGYLPVKEPLRSKKIKELELSSIKEKQTQIFIETPYRNNQLIADLFKVCLPTTKLTIAYHITAPDTFIKTKTIENWKKSKPTLEKNPAVFLILG